MRCFDRKLYENECHTRHRICVWIFWQWAASNIIWSCAGHSAGFRSSSICFNHPPARWVDAPHPPPEGFREQWKTCAPPNLDSLWGIFYIHSLKILSQCDLRSGHQVKKTGSKSNLSFLQRHLYLYIFSENFRSVWPKVTSPGQESRYIVKFEFSSKARESHSSWPFLLKPSGYI